MNLSATVLGALGYIVPTFPLAYFWHLVLFRERYTAWQYFGDSPAVPLGFLAILIQGIALSVLYGAVAGGAELVHPALFALLAGILHWSIHVIAAMAKDARLRNRGYFLMETLYLALQFGIFGGLLSIVYAVV